MLVAAVIQTCLVELHQVPAKYVPSSYISLKEALILNTQFSHVFRTHSIAHALPVGHFLTVTFVPRFVFQPCMIKIICGIKPQWIEDES
jgi:hypothetical protein